MEFRKYLLKRMFFLVAITGIPAALSRLIRNKQIPSPEFLFNLLDNEFFAYLEHFAAGFGVPCLLAIALLIFTVFKDKPKNKPVNNVQMFVMGNWFTLIVFVFAGLTYSWHIYEHELIKQMTQKGYWGDPETEPDILQIIVGVSGILSFWVWGLKYAKV